MVLQLLQTFCCLAVMETLEYFGTMTQKYADQDL